MFKHFIVSVGCRSLLIRSFFLIFFFRVSLENLIEDGVEKQIWKWCDFHSAGILFNKGRYEICQEKFLKNNFEIQKEILKNTTLKFGVLKNINGYEFDCGVRVEENLRTLKNGYSHFIVDLLQDALKFRINYTFSSVWGAYDSSFNDWNGLVKLVKDNEIDVIICHWVMSDILAGMAEYLFPTLETKEAFVFEPDNLPLSRDVFQATLSHRLWIFFVATTFLITASFKFSTFVHSKLRPDHEPWKWDEVILWAVAAISQQSYSRHPRGSSCRTMFLIGYTITYLMYTGFAAGITSLLALQSRQNKLTVEDVGKMKLKVIFHQDEFYFDFLEENALTSFKINFNAPNIYTDSLNGIFSKIKESDFVGYGTNTVLANYLHRESKFYRENIFVVFPIPTKIRKKSFLVKKSFRFKDIFNYWLLKLRETGLLDVGKKRYLKTGTSGLVDTNNWLSADLNNVLSAFEFLIGGWILSAFVWIIEMVWEKRSRKKLEKKFIYFNRFTFLPKLF